MISRTGTRYVEVLPCVSGAIDEVVHQLTLRAITTFTEFCSAHNIFALRIITSDLFYRANMLEEGPMITYLEE
jgi:hypothetical protein